MTISPIYPIILQNGTVADATQVMADFYQIQNDVNANAAHNGANNDITSLSGLTTPLPINEGGTGATTAVGAVAALGAATAGANSNITSLSGLTTPLSIPQGGTGNITAAAAIQALLSGQSVTGGVTLDDLVLTANLSVAGTTVLAAATGETTATNDSTDNLATTAFVNPGNSHTTSGYEKLSSGFIFQWGTMPNTTNEFINFPIEFPNACFGVQATANGTSTGWGRVGNVTTTTSGFQWQPGDAAASGYYFAYGF